MLESILPTIKSYLLGKNMAPAICSADTVFRVAAFNWRRFRRRIVIGYAFGWSLGIAGAIYANSLLKSLVALFIFPFIIAYLIWEPALSGLSLGLAKKVNAFVIQGGRLISTDGTQSFDLTNAEVAIEKKSGLAYSLEFVTLTLKDGTKHYFLPYDNNWDTFVTALKSASHHG